MKALKTLLLLGAVALGAVLAVPLTKGAPRDPFTPEQRKYWALQKVVRLEPPAVKAAAWTRNPIDRFVAAELETKNIQPGPPADRVTLLRRASFDLIGLPPTPE